MNNGARLFRAGFVVIVGLTGMIGLGCSSRPTGPLQVPLVFRPTDQLSIGAAEGVMAKSATVVVEDARDRKDQVGVNVEKQALVEIVTSSDPRAFVQEAVSRNLAASGVRVGPGGERVITIALTRFWVEEGNTYSGNVAATVRVTPAGGGQTLWEGGVTGTNTRFGRSLSVENYQECFSDAVMKMCNNLLSDSGFRAAMK